MILPGIPARRGTPAALAGQRQQAPRPPRYSQAQLRQRRRTGLVAAKYGAKWSLRNEIADQLTPLAERIATLPDPARFTRSVRSVAETTHELVGTVVAWCAESDALARTRHLADEPGKRKYAVTTLVDLAQRPALPEVTDAMLADGSWAAVLAAMADGCDASFSALLGKSHPSNAAELRGQLSRTDRLVRLLRETLDHAAVLLDKRINSAAAAAPQATTTDPRAVLAEMGVTAP
ncbi:hypothetical protein EB73_26445 [Mycobacterium sp. SWH-M3]|nr:hypothetical protein EB73_26445 [Mycobacterium sp. SWH-M3]